MERRQCTREACRSTRRSTRACRREPRPRSRGRPPPTPADPYAALVTVDPATGFVKAVVGGRAYGTEKFNIATMGRRQPGSAFKPFVLAAALEPGISPQSYYQGPARLCPKGWIPGCV